MNGLVEVLLELRPGQVAAFSVIDHGAAKEEIVMLVGRKINVATELEVKSKIARTFIKKPVSRLIALFSLAVVVCQKQPAANRSVR